MRVAVTGASGFVGGAVVSHLLEAGHEVVALCRRPVRERAGLVHRPWDLTTGRLTDAPSVDAVVHAGAHVDEWDPWSVHEAVTVSGTRAVLDTWPATQVVLISSASVYPLRGAGRPRWVLTEDDAPTRRPLSAYTRAKIAQERIVLARGDAVVLRPHAVHGTGDTTLLPRLARARRGGRLVCPGGGRTLVHLTDVRLVASAAARACESDCGATVLNVADERPLELRDIVAGVAAANGWHERPLFTGAPAAWAAALVSEGTARLLRSRTAPLLTAYGVSHLAVSRAFATSRLREHLGITPAATDLTRWTGGG
ncbi:nucleoside-diphosphate-sugar epimerase [Humibacillus xanthopallidus]|uniref:Nucleoside-diphosphate-sugar epimerase n=1 Tax=Humibacillus xanthopallidus TaxID=412689 RepID=A0A543PT22_9MICO|nr:NAD(P)-dependent oxidoreductase [Humibacillus xanthopallidus]TQN47235.1 nucleoside-diphosphate-sugar epimerase [Humibacillus xanthopallidus]